MTAIDLRPRAFVPDRILQTRVAHQDAVMMRDGSGIDLFFVVASSAQMVQNIAQALSGEELPG